MICLRDEYKRNEVWVRVIRRKQKPGYACNSVHDIPSRPVPKQSLAVRTRRTAKTNDLASETQSQNNARFLRRSNALSKQLITGRYTYPKTKPSSGLLAANRRNKTLVLLISVHRLPGSLAPSRDVFSLRSGGLSGP